MGHSAGVGDCCHRRDHRLAFDFPDGAECQRTADLANSRCAVARPRQLRRRGCRWRDYCRFAQSNHGGASRRRTHAARASHGGCFACDPGFRLSGPPGRHPYGRPVRHPARAGVALFDRWSFEILAEIRQATSAVDQRRAIYDLAVVFIVMGFTIFYSILAGVIAGCLMAGTIFVVNMSRPVVRRTFTGAEMQSKRIRPARDIAILRETGSQRAVLQLEGVLFFGNADDLSDRIKQIFNAADMVALDLRGVSDIDVSGATILESIIAKSRGWKKDLLLCEIPAAQGNVIRTVVTKAAKNDDPIKPDLDAALEWMEERSLHLNADRRVQADILDLHDIDFLAGIEGGDLERLSGFLVQRDFAQGETICREGEAGDRMWLLAKGSVSVRLSLGDGRGFRRITSLARGTTLGEMALVESSRRSAPVGGEEPVFCYELLRSNFDSLVAGYPGIATKLLANLSRELARRLRKTSDDLRNLS